jgi:hypothetical protein
MNEMEPKYAQDDPNDMSTELVEKGKGMKSLDQADKERKSALAEDLKNNKPSFAQMISSPNYGYKDTSKPVKRTGYKEHR